MAYVTRNLNNCKPSLAPASGQAPKPVSLTVNAFYRCNKNVATYNHFGRNAPVFTNVVATPSQLYAFAMTGQPTGYKVHGVSLKNFGFFPLKLDDETKKAQEAVVQAAIADAYPTSFDDIDDEGKKKKKNGKGEGTSKSKKGAAKKKKKRGVKRPLENESNDEATEGEEESTDLKALLEKNSVASDHWLPRGPLGEVRLIAAVLLLPTEKAQVLIFAENALYRCTLSPTIKLEVLADGEQIAEAFRKRADAMKKNKGKTGEKKVAERLISVTFSRAAVLDQASSTAYVKAVIRNEAVGGGGGGQIGCRSSDTRHQLITYQLDTETHKPGVSPVGKWARLELPYKAHEGRDKDPGELLKSAKCIALWKRQLFVLLKTPIDKFDKEGNPIVFNRLFACFKVMIIRLDEGNRWRVVDTAELAINKSCPPMLANKFKWAQRGPEGQHLLGVFTRYDEDEDGEDHLNRQKNVVNSVWSLDLETLQWSCLNTGKMAVSRRANAAAPADIRELKMVKTPSVVRMTIAANADGLLILPRGDVDVPLDPNHSIKTEFFYVPLN